jgi:hypothetical protein
MVFESKREDFRTVQRKVFTDNTVEAILKGTQRLYVVALWKYKLQGNPNFNVKYLCVYYVNTLELAVLKRGIIGVYHHTSQKHLGRYVDEFSFRLNEAAQFSGDRSRRPAP